jgi:hypothetical protein
MGFSPGVSGTTIRHNRQTTHITQNNTTIKRNTVHRNTHTMNTLHRMKIQQLQLQYTQWKYNNYNYNYKSSINKNNHAITQQEQSWNRHCLKSFPSFNHNLLRFTSIHFTSLHFTSLRWSPFNFPLFVTFLTLFLKLLGLHERVPKTSAGSWFQTWMYLWRIN